MAGTKMVRLAQVNKLLDMLREDAISQNRYVTIFDLNREVNVRLNVDKFEDLGICSFWSIDTVRQIADIDNTINVFIRCYLLRSSISTLYDLELQLLKKMHVTSFADLGVGSLLKNPLIVQEFKPCPKLQSVPKIEISDVILVLEEALSSSKERVQEKDLEDRLVKKIGLSRPQELCVKIKGLGLYISKLRSVIKEGRNQTKIAMKLAEEACNLRIAARKEERTAKLQKLCEDTLRKLADDEDANNALNEEWAIQKACATAIGSFFQNAFSTLYPEKGDLQSPKLLEFLQSQVLGRVFWNCLVRGVSQYSNAREAPSTVQVARGRVRARTFEEDEGDQENHVIDGGSDDLAHSVQKRRRIGDEADEADSSQARRGHCQGHDSGATAIKVGAAEIAFDSDAGKAMDSSASRVSRSRVTESVSKQMRAALAEAEGTLVGLGAIRRSVECELGIGGFDALGHGDFLDFVCSDQELLRCASESFCRGPSDARRLREAERVAAQALYALQDAPTLRSADDVRDALQWVLRRQFCMSHDDWEHALDPALAVSPHGEGAPQAAIACGAAMLAGCEDELAGLSLDTGVLAKAASAVLRRCPPLEDVGAYAQWESAFQPALGSLREFLVAHPVEGSSLLELPGDRLVKLDPRASPASLAPAMRLLDPRASAVVLVSIVCQHRGFVRSPLALLKAQARYGFEGAAQRSGEDSAAELFLDIVQCVPELFRAAIFRRVLYEAFGLAVGEQHCRGLLGKAAGRKPGLDAMLFSLGAHLRVAEWEVCETEREGLCSLPHVTQTASSMEICAEKSSDSNSGRQAIPNLAVWRSTSMESGPNYKTLGEVTSDKVEPSEAAARAVIDCIRECEFGVGLNLDDSGRSLREAQNARIGRALQRLSDDLYSSDSHFLLELIQNADDNTYLDGVRPELHFIQGEKYLVVVNNEKGFEEADIRALCDIGKSTKQERTGFIGQKGIGFKAVFRVSDAPQIHSNGFHIKFDSKANGAIGSILPEWIGGDALRQLVETEELYSRLKSWPTVIALPICQPQKLNGMFDGFYSSMLLFMQKIRCISVSSHTQNGPSKIFERKESSSGIVEISNNGSIAEYIKGTQTIVQPGIRKLDLPVSSTDITVAFPVLPPPEAGDPPWPQQDVYAFLPVRSYGFRFLLHADFALSSSRESVDRDSPWNQLLRSEVAEAFALAVQSAQRHIADPVASTNLWLAAVPTDSGEVQGFFNPCVRAIHAKLSTTSCVWTQGGEWTSVSEVLVSNDEYRSLVDPNDLKRVTNHKLAHAGLNRRALIAVGAAEVGVPTVLQLLSKGTYDSADSQLPILNFIADRFVMGRLSAQDQKMIKTLPILLLMDGSLVKLQDGPVFFWPTEDNQVAKAAESLSLDMSGSLRFLHANLSRSDTNLHRLFSFLGLKNLDWECAMRDYVVPSFQRSLCMNPTVENLASLLCFACSFWVQRDKSSAVQDKLCSDLKLCAIVVTTQGPISVCTDNGRRVHFSTAYSSIVDSYLIQSLMAWKWAFIDDVYLQKSQESHSTWREFLEYLGVTDLFTVQKIRTKLDDGDKIRAFCQQRGCAVGSVPMEGFIIDDYHCPDLGDILNQTASLPDKNRFLNCCAQLFDANWVGNGYADSLFCKIEGSTGPSIASDFLMTISGSPWLVAEDSNPCHPAELWERNGAVQAVFGSMPIRCVHPSIKNPQFLQAMKVKTAPTAELVVEELRRWSSQSAFSASLREISKVYEFLSTFYRGEGEAFDAENNRLIFLPDKGLCLADGDTVRAPEETLLVTGRFYGVSQVRLQDRSNTVESVLEAELRVLKPYYGNFQDWER